MVGKVAALNMHKMKKQHTTHNLHSPHAPEGHGSIHKPKQHISFFASPLDPKATAWLKSKHEKGNLVLGRRPTIAQFEDDPLNGGIFRKQHEASTLELFFDLFFVANLAIFTTNHQHESALSVANYIGFFAILWSTWFHVSIFDVRFYVDSIFNRFFKLVIFGIFTAFTGLGPIFDVVINGGTTRAFHGIALVLMMSRLVLLIQYASVLWFVRSFKQTILPLCLMMLLYFCTSMAFFATYLDGGNTSTGQWSGMTHLFVWYGVILLEALLGIAISSTWRILSFKYTHLVERVGLLTLIIMGEGIIGLTKSTAYMLAGTNISVWSNLGSILAAVTLIYTVYILYFSPIDHDGFGTIRQQIWTLCHFPLHVALLLTEEGSAVTLLWDQCIRAQGWFQAAMPSINAPAGTATSTTQWIDQVNKTMNATATRYHYVKLKDVYDYSADLYKVKNISDPFGSKAWNDQVSLILNNMTISTSNFFFQNFNFEKPKSLYTAKDPSAKLQIYYNAYLVSFTFFYVAAGALLLILAAMYWVGKKNKTREEWASIVTRLVVGAALPLVVLTAYINQTDTSFRFDSCAWIIPVVTFGFLFVMTLDNLISWVGDRVNGRFNTFHDHNDNEDDGLELEKSIHHHIPKNRDARPTYATRLSSLPTTRNQNQNQNPHQNHRIPPPEIDEEHQRLVRTHSYTHDGGDTTTPLSGIETSYTSPTSFTSFSQPHPRGQTQTQTQGYPFPTSASSTSHPQTGGTFYNDNDNEGDHHPRTEQDVPSSRSTIINTHSPQVRAGVDAGYHALTH